LKSVRLLDVQGWICVIGHDMKAWLRIAGQAVLFMIVAHLAFAQSGDFPGLEKAMNTETYEMAGLSKLTEKERAVLDKFIREYAAGKQKDAASSAASEAVDRAIKEGKVQTPEVIESSMTGTFKGYGLKSLFSLANGQTWKPTNDETVTYSPVENPKVIIYRDPFGYKMFVAGAGTIRVKRVK
jgi:hypothetical protein